MRAKDAAGALPDDLAQNLAMIDELGTPKTYNHYPTGWATAFSTPFKMFKRYTYQRGICAADSQKTPGCDGGSFSKCGSNTYPAGSFPQCVSPLGVFDLNGNAAEHMNLPLAPDEMSSAGSAKLGVTESLAEHWARGSAGAEALAREVVKTVGSKKADFKFLYPDDMPLIEKVRTIAREIYRADDIIADKKIRQQFADLEAGGFGHLPICVAKTQYSFTTDANIKGAPSDHVVAIRELRLSAGAEFVVAVCGEIMTMPGLPRVPAANSIEVGADGRITGLF